MCTLYYFYFLSSRVIQLTPYFVILLVLIFIVNQNFKLLNQHSILLLFSFALLPFCFLCVFILLLFVLLLSYNYHCYSLINIINYSLIYLFIYLFIFISLSNYLFCDHDLYKAQLFKSSPHIKFTTVYTA